MNRFEVLRSSLLFSELPIASLRALGEYFEELEGAQGDTLFLAGEPGSSLFVIATGSCVARVADGAGRSVDVRTMSATESFGELSLFVRGPRLTSVVAREDVCVLELDASSYDRLQEQDPRLALQVVACVAQRVGGIIAGARTELGELLVRNLAAV